MQNVLKQLSVEKLYDLRDYISCSEGYGIDTKQQLMDSITDEMRCRQLYSLMKPLAEQFIQERGE